MIQVGPHTRVLVAVEPIDFRAGIDQHAGENLNKLMMRATLSVSERRS